MWRGGSRKLKEEIRAPKTGPKPGKKGWRGPRLWDLIIQGRAGLWSMSWGKGRRMGLAG